MPDDQEQESVEETEQTKDTESPAGDESQGEETEQDQEPEQPEEDELEISFGDEKEEKPEETESGLLTDLRSRHRSLKKKYRQTLHELEQIRQPEKPADPGPKPTLESCDYDSDQYEEKIADWYESKRKADEESAKAAAKAEEEKAEQQKIYQNYSERKSALKVKDFKEAEEEVAEQLDITKQNVILKYAEKPELIVYALGKNPAKLAALSKLDPFQFAKELGRLEGNLKVGKRKPKTQPEKTISSTGSLTGTTDRTLEKLREEAARTGDMSKVMAYKRKKRRAAG